MTYEIGIDVSHHQGAMNFEQSISAGARFIIIRAGYSGWTTHTPSVDAQFRTNVAKLRSLDVPAWGVYYFMTPSQNVVAQAKAFAEWYEESEAPLPPFVDVENRNDIVENASALRKFLETLLVETNRTPYIYTRGEYWNRHYRSLCDFINEMGCGLWVARYHDGINHPWLDNDKLRPACWGNEYDWSLWQYSADGNGKGHEFGAESISIDMNRYNGDAKCFFTEFGVPLIGVDMPEPVEPPKDCIQNAAVHVSGLRVRSRPSTVNGTVVGYLQVNEIVKITETFFDGSGNQWGLLFSARQNNLAGWAAMTWYGDVFIKVIA